MPTWPHHDPGQGTLALHTMRKNLRRNETTEEEGQGMIQAIALVLDFAPSHWTSSTRMVAIALADYANTDTGNAWPSIANLSRRSGVSVRQVQRCLREIEADGWIERTRLHSVGTNLWIWRKRIALGGDTHVTPPVTPVSPPLRGKG